MSILSLCSGYGGLEQAIDQALGHQTIDAYCDNYKPARQVLKTHNPWTRIHNDVNDEALLNYKSSIIAFGFPCQDLSNAGKRAGINGTRSSLFYTCMNVVRAVQPTEIIIENATRTPSTKSCGTPDTAPDGHAHKPAKQDSPTGATAYSSTHTKWGAHTPATLKHKNPPQSHPHSQHPPS